MGIQESINSVIGTASGAVSTTVKEQEAKAKALAKNTPKAKTQTYQNYSLALGEKAKANLKQELKGKREQRKRINKRISLMINTDPRLGGGL